MKKVIAIIGPTGVGKTSLGVEVAKWLDSEIISGDSIQVYQGLDIGSAKVTKEEMQGIPHHLIDILPLTAHYSVYDFQQQGRSIMEKLHNDGKIPIVVGGTGLYIKSLLYDYEFETTQDDQVSEHYKEMSNEALYARLQEVDPISAQKIHPNNRQRLVRALTIFDTQGKSKSEIELSQKHELLYDAYVIGLTCERDMVYARINKRVEMMLENGLLEEVTRLAQDPNLFSYQGMQGIGYKEFRLLANGEMSLEECVEEIKKHSRQFAKRQYTWFRNQMNVHWYDISEANYLSTIQADLKAWIEEEK